MSTSPQVSRPRGSYLRLLLWVSLLAAPVCALVLADPRAGTTLGEAAEAGAGVMLTLGGPLILALLALEAIDLVLDRREGRR